MRTGALCWLTLIGVLAVEEASGTGMCVAPTITGSVRISLSSRRNQTGHWLSQIKFEHTDNREAALAASAPVLLDLEQSTAVCEGAGATLISATITAPPPQAGPGYRLIPGMGRYKFHNTSAIWSDARQICASEGAHLAIINSPEESAVLRDLFKEYPSVKDVMYNDYAFIGFHDLEEEGRYVTIFDEPLQSTGFMVWGGGQPDNAGGNPGEDCGSMHRNGLLNDLICSRKHAFICEQELS